MRGDELTEMQVLAGIKPARAMHEDWRLTESIPVFPPGAAQLPNSGLVKKHIVPLRGPVDVVDGDGKVLVTITTKTPVKTHADRALLRTTQTYHRVVRLPDGTVGYVPTTVLG